VQYTDKDRVMALCGVFQAARLVQQIARTGMCEQAPLDASLKSIFTLDCATPEDAYGSLANVEFGARTLLAQLGPGTPDSNRNQAQDSEVARYVIGVLVLERKLIKRPDLLDKITHGVENATLQLEHYPLSHENVIANLADTYAQTISTLNPRIMVNGEHQHVANPTNANKIRALLLAAIRSAVLWRQCGGNRWQLFFNRKSIISQAQDIITEMSNRTLH